MNSHNEINVGIDTGKQQLDIYVRPLGEAFSVDNTPSGVRKAVTRLKQFRPTRIVIEATGRFGNRLCHRRPTRQIARDRRQPHSHQALCRGHRATGQKRST